MIRGSNSDPISGFRQLAREFSWDVGTHTTASGYHLSATSLVSANNTPTAALVGLGSVATPVNTFMRQSSNLCFTMALSGGGTGITYVITVNGVNYYGDAVSEDVTLTDAILVASTNHVYQKTTSIVCKSFAGTVGTSTIGVGYSNVGGTVSLANVNGYRVPLPSKTITYNDLSSVSVTSQSTAVLNVGLASATSTTAPTWTVIGAPYYCLMLRGSTDGSTLAATLPSNPMAAVTVRLKAGIGLG